MGIKLISSVEYDVYKDVPTPGNPNPANYKIISTLKIGNILIAEIVYPDCKNYEGKKILVFEGIDAETWVTKTY